MGSALGRVREKVRGLKFSQIETGVTNTAPQGRVTRVVFAAPLVKMATQIRVHNEHIRGLLLDHDRVAFLPGHDPMTQLVRLISRDLQPGVVQVTVTDTGEGIASEDVPHLFERFYRATDHRNGGSRKGHGLGLAISREIVRAHGGEIWATSEVGRGTTFVFTLPTWAPAESPASGR